jgi:hypothetical protein
MVSSEQIITSTGANEKETKNLGKFMKDSTLDYTKIIGALNSSMDLIEGEGISDETVIEQLSAAQQMVQQAMTYSLSRDRG